VADEGPEIGGDDAGPNPYQLVLAGLAQCTAATLRMYANRKGWALGEVKVRARLLRTGDGATKVERIERTIVVTGDLSSEQRGRLAEIAGRTPVTRTLLGSVTIDTTLT
jgi:putative redox protein